MTYPCRWMLQVGKIREVQGTVVPELQKSFIRALGESPDEVEEVKSKANELYKEGHLDQACCTCGSEGGKEGEREAIALYTEAIDRDPDCVDTRTVATLYYNRSAALRKRGEFEKALDDALFTVAAYCYWSTSDARCGRYAEALTELKVVQRADPTFDDDLEEKIRKAVTAYSETRQCMTAHDKRKLPTLVPAAVLAEVTGWVPKTVLRDICDLPADCKETEGPGLSFIQAKALARGNTTAKKEALEYHWSSGRGNYPNYGVAKHPGPFDLA
ncbi:unnamed protein product, partial [Symbiodinium microadriaticum]